MGRFDGKVAVVTGGAKGIGRAAVEAFAREGAAVVAADVDKTAAQALVGGIKKARGRALAVKADVSRIRDAEKIAQEAVKAFGGIDILVNNAGIQTYGTVVDTPEETWDKTINVNQKGIFLVSKFCVPEIIKRGGGAVVNVASVQGLASQPNVVAYTSTKGAIIAMTRTMALDHAPHNIRVNCVCPGSVDTPMLRWAAEVFVPEDPEGAVVDWGKMHPLGRVAKAEEIAQVILFLASSDASFMTGASVVVDGGLIIGI
ncbi:MAG: glucose 1-dehydrogenase [Anaerolineae bacterium]|nr:glucose 1-dehydrogenase [Anaerolineae bacterium]